MIEGKNLKYPTEIGGATRGGEAGVCESGGAFG